jgi:hypothetical protein
MAGKCNDADDPELAAKLTALPDEEVRNARFAAQADAANGKLVFLYDIDNSDKLPERYSLVELLMSDLYRGERVVSQVAEAQLGPGHWYPGGSCYRHVMALSSFQQGKPLKSTLIRHPGGIGEPVLIVLLP